MELDHIKNIWEKEEVSETPEISMDKQREIHMPLEKIRQNMRMEFWSSIFSIVLIFIAIFYFVDDIKLKTYCIVLILSAILVTGFYYLKFFSLYKEISEHAFTTREMLRDLKTQFDLNRQYYISYYIAYVPFLVASYILIFDNNPGFNKYPEVLFVTFLFLIVIGGLAALYFVGNWWYQQYYGKYIKQIENLATDLK